MTRTVLDDFLDAHPEYIPDVATRTVDGRPEPCMTADGTIAFTQWAIRTGRCNRVRGEKVIAAVREKVASLKAGTSTIADGMTVPGD